MIRIYALVPLLSLFLSGCLDRLDSEPRNTLWSLEGQLPSAVAAGKPRPPIKLEYRLTAYEQNWFDLNVSALGVTEIRRYVLSADSSQKGRKDLLVERFNPLREGARLEFFNAERLDRLILDVEYQSGIDTRRHTFSIPVNQVDHTPLKTCDEPPCYLDAELN